MQVAAFELLQKVLVTITPAHVDRIKEYQRRAETCLLDLLLKGAASPVSTVFLPSWFYCVLGEGPRESGTFTAVNTIDGNQSVY